MNELTLKEKGLLLKIIDEPELIPFFFKKVTGIEWFDPLNDSDFFIPTQNPKPTEAKKEGYFQIPFWPATNYLVGISNEFNIPKNEEYAEKVLNIIRECTQYAKNEEYGNYHTWRQFAKILNNIPLKLISSEDISLVDYWLNDKYGADLVADEVGIKWLTKLLSSTEENSNELSLRLIEILFQCTFKEHTYGTYKSKEAFLRFDNWHAEKIIESIANEAGRTLGLPLIKQLKKLLSDILEMSMKDSWSVLWRPAIGEDEQNKGHENAGTIILQAFRDSLISFVGTNPEDGAIYVNELLSDELTTIKRIAIYVISQQYNNLSTLTDKVIDEELINDKYRHELWHFFNDNYSSFDDKTKEKVLSIIENIIVTSDDGENDEKASAYKRSQWLSALKNFSESILKKYKEYIDTTGFEPDHPDFPSYMTTGFAKHESPFELSELLPLDVESLISKINSFKDGGGFDEPDIEGLSKRVKELVKTDPAKFYKVLDKFLDTNLAYIYEVIEAYRELWNEKQLFLPWNDVWKELLAFSKQLMDCDAIWSEEFVQPKTPLVTSINEIVSSIANLITDGIRSDDNAFDEKYLDAAVQLMKLLLEKQEGGIYDNKSDAVIIAINSPRGNCIQAMINITLRRCRLADKSNNGHLDVWGNFEDFYNKELHRSDDFDFATLITYYLPNFLFMSDSWILENLENIFDQSNYQKWLCAIQGLFFIRRIDRDIYNYLKVNGDFIKALDDNNLSDHIKEPIIHHIVAFYFNDVELLSDYNSLISILLNRNKLFEIQQLIWFVWAQKKEDTSDVKGKIFELWGKIIEINDIKTEESKIISSRLCNWSTIIDKIDESNKKLLLTIAPFADEDYNSSDLLENLARLSDTQPFEVHEIWMKMLEGCNPDYPKDAIKKILHNLLRKDDGKKKATEIVDEYIRRGYEYPYDCLNQLLQEQSDD